LNAPAADRNKAPILEVLKRVLPARGNVLEVASGTGQHVVHFAAALPQLQWIPSDPDPSQRMSIAAHVSQADLSNVAPPLNLDVLDEWDASTVDAVIVANLLHISARETLPGLCRGAAAVLRPGGVLHVYGPFKRGGKHTSDGNARFDQLLRAQDRRWGLWNVEDVVDTASEYGLEVTEVIAMPANNFSLVFHRSDAPAAKP
jgi:SAM-dependent methyltransferase